MLRHVSLTLYLIVGVWLVPLLAEEEQSPTEVLLEFEMSDVFLVPRSEDELSINAFANKIRGGKMEPARLEKLSKLVVSQLDAIKGGKIQEAYNKYTSAAFRRRSSLKDFESFIQEQPGLTNHKTARITDGRQKDNVIVLKAKVIDAYNEAFNIVYIMHKQGDEWRVSQMLLTSYFPTLRNR